MLTSGPVTSKKQGGANLQTRKVKFNSPYKKSRTRIGAPYKTLRVDVVDTIGKVSNSLRVYRC